MNEMTQSNSELTQPGAPDYSQYYDDLDDVYEASEALREIDPVRFQSYTKEQIIFNVENAGWMLAKGRGGRICVRRENGRIISGSPAPLPLPTVTDNFQVAVDEFRQQLIEMNQLTNMPQIFFEALTHKVNQGDIKALQLYADLFLSPAKQGKAPSLSARTLNVYQGEQKEEDPPVRNV